MTAPNNLTTAPLAVDLADTIADIQAVFDAAATEEARQSRERAEKAERERDAMKARYRLLLDSATGLREHIKDVYNAACFDPAIAPEGTLDSFRRIVLESAHKALIESVSVRQIQYAYDLADQQPTSKESHQMFDDELAEVVFVGGPYDSETHWLHPSARNIMRPVVHDDGTTTWAMYVRKCPGSAELEFVGEDISVFDKRQERTDENDETRV